MGSKKDSTDQLKQYVEGLRQHMPELVERYGVKSLGIFGSYVWGEQRKSSDLDLLVEFSENPSLLKFIEMEHYLSEVLGVHVDLVMKDVLKPAIGRNVMRELVPV